MKILHIVNRLEVGGVEVGILNLLSKSDENFYVVPIKGIDELFIQSLSSDAKRRIIFSKNKINLFFRCLNLKPNIIVSSLWRAHIFRVLLSLFFPSASTVHFIHNSRYAHFIDRIITKVSLKICTLAFSDSETTRDWARNHGCDKEIKIVPMNVSFLPENIAVSPLKYNDLIKGKVRFVFVGRYCEQKNFDLAFEFLRELKNNGIEVEYDLYGRDDNYVDKIKYKIKKYALDRNVRIHESVDPSEVEFLLKSYDFYLQTSSAEGMAISVFQSIRAGLIPVVTPVGEIASYTENGKNAFYLDSCNIELLANKFCETDFSKYSAGTVINNGKYPIFHKIYFESASSVFTKN